MPNDTGDAQAAAEQAAAEQAAAEQAAAERAAAAAVAEAFELYHVVRPGESWESIASAYSTSVEALHDLNADTPHFSNRSVSVNATVRVR